MDNSFESFMKMAPLNALKKLQAVVATREILNADFAKTVLKLCQFGLFNDKMQYQKYLNLHLGICESFVDNPIVLAVSDMQQKKFFSSFLAQLSNIEDLPSENKKFYKFYFDVYYLISISFDLDGSQNQQQFTRLLMDLRRASNPDISAENTPIRMLYLKAVMQISQIVDKPSKKRLLNEMLVVLFQESSVRPKLSHAQQVMINYLDYVITDLLNNTQDFDLKMLYSDIFLSSVEFKGLMKHCSKPQSLKLLQNEQMDTMKYMALIDGDNVKPEATVNRASWFQLAKRNGGLRNVLSARNQETTPLLGGEASSQASKISIR